MKKILTILTAFAFLASCSTEDKYDGEDRSIKIRISPDPITFASDGTTPDGESSLDVVPVIKIGSKVIKQDWTAVCDADFASLENTVVVREFTETYSQKIYSTEENGFRLSVDPNTGLNRTFTVTIAYGDSTATFSYAQKGELGDPYINLSKKSITIVSDVTDAQTVTYTTNLEGVTVSCDASGWCSVEHDAGTGTITITCTENTSTEEDRVANIVVTGTTGATTCTETIVLTQLAVGKSAYDGIQSAEDFVAFAKRFNAGEGTSLFQDADGVIRIKADIDMSTVAGWTPIGTLSAPFDEVLDGQGHKIYNFAMNTESDLTGIFGCVSGTVKDLVIGSKDGENYDGVSTFTTGMDDSAAAWAYVGSIAARAASGASFSNVINFASVGTSSGANKTRIGGLVGLLNGAISFEDCENHGTVFNNDKASVTASLLAGFAAVIDGTAAVTFTNCVNYGDITSTSAAVTRLGGFVGQSNTTAGTTFSGCKNYGAVSMSPDNTAVNWTAIAGICGQPNSQPVTLTGCENHGTISSYNLKQVARCGGMVGTAHKSTVIENCLNTGKISIIYDVSTPLTNWQSAGGIASIAENQTTVKMTGNVNKGDIYVKVNSNVAHANQMAAGGIIGVPANGTYTDNVNYGSVYCENTATTCGSAIAGGVIGFPNAGTYTGCQNFGDVQAVSATAGLNGGVAKGNACCGAGGIFGIYRPNADISGISYGTVTCNAAAGGLVGYNFGTGAVSGQFGGTVNGTAVTADNASTLAVGLNNGTLGTVTLYVK